MLQTDLLKLLLIYQLERKRKGLFQWLSKLLFNRGTIKYLSSYLCVGHLEYCAKEWLWSVTRITRQRAIEKETEKEKEYLVKMGTPLQMGNWVNKCFFLWGFLRRRIGIMNKWAKGTTNLNSHLILKHGCKITLETASGSSKEYLLVAHIQHILVSNSNLDNRCITKTKTEWKGMRKNRMGNECYKPSSPKKTKTAVTSARKRY